MEHLEELLQSVSLFNEVEQVKSNPFWAKIAPICEHYGRVIDLAINEGAEVLPEDECIINYLTCGIMAYKLGKIMLSNIARDLEKLR